MTKVGNAAERLKAQWRLIIPETNARTMLLADICSDDAAVKSIMRLVLKEQPANDITLTLEDEY